MANAPNGQVPLFNLDPKPAPRKFHSADVIRYDQEIVYPSLGQMSSDHVRRIRVDNKSFWMLSDNGRAVFTDSIRETGLYAENHPDLRKLAREHPDVSLPMRASTIKFQIVNLLVAHRDFGFTRTDLEAFNQAMLARGIKQSADVIQSARHPEQWGCKRIADVKVDGQTVYLLPDDLEYYALLRKSEEEFGELGWEEHISLVKQWHLDIANTPNEFWDVGHTRPGSTTVFPQPKKRNRPDRDKYYYDPFGQRLTASPQYAVALMKRHYTVEEMRRVAQELAAELAAAEAAESEE